MGKKTTEGARKKPGIEDKLSVAEPADVYTLTPEQRHANTVLGASIMAVVVVVVATIIGVVAWQRNVADRKNQQQNESAYSKLADSKIARPSDYVTRDGAIQFTRDGVVKGALGSKWKSAKTVDVWIDPLCPGCGAVDQTLSSSYAKYLEAGKIVLRIHPISIMDRGSTDYYSTRAASSIYRMLDVAPGKTYAYITLLMSADKQPEEGPGYKPVSDADLQKRAVEVGVPARDAKKLTDGKYKEYLAAATDYSTSRKELYREGTHEFATPIVRVGDQNMSFDDPDTKEIISQFERLVDRK